MNYNLTIEQYKQLISQPEYQMVQYPWVGYEEFEQLSSYGNLAHLFEELTEQLGRVPTQTEYINEGLARSKAFFIGKAKPNGDRWLPIQKDKNGKVLKWHNFKWDERLEKAIVQRIARSYPSHMVEYSTILLLKSYFPQYKIGANDYLDGVMGVDIVVGSEQHDKVAYIHITSASSYSDHWLKKKEDRKGVIYQNGVRHEYTRNFKKGHIHLSFSLYESESTEIINSIPLLKISHIQQVLETAFMLAPYMDTWKKKEQLCQLHHWLKDKGIEQGLGSVWL
ncbi:hypothetical protein LRS37_12885 [Neobacillus sedimentimangrovi]|uniref:Uncharacterized protein n=1 Tax=Neobacillus sedimentimangrovi TaxID=2699460 RepID=A0ABS8QKH6_9BACI|nr:hypothetical protein [Neobacillus sedimentimangrovi]MCD4839745.1 hypothetical protein [Neobacillus sedimentimangrovi]